jgi:glycerol uptake facilitator-like aquaporin/protein-tyrosine-phosphatase
MPAPLLKRAASEALGTSLLLATVVGSGIMGDRLSGGNEALALLANSLATGAVLVALILALGGISGAQLNPVVTLAAARTGGLAWREVPVYVGAQIAGAFLGVATAHSMFGLEPFSASLHARSGMPQLVSEFVATFGLLAVIRGCSRSRPEAIALAVGVYITAAYWFTASTSFANPAVTLARAATDTFSGIRSVDAPGFIVAQLLGAGLATALFRWLAPPLPGGALPERRATGEARGRVMRQIVFACVHNAGRSQMAAAFFNALADRSQARAISAGTQPAARVHPEVVAVMREVGFDLAGAKPSLLVAGMMERADVLVTLGCGERCPSSHGVRVEDWPVEDPAGLPLERVRAIRDEVRARVERFVQAEGLGRERAARPAGA